MAKPTQRPIHTYFLKHYYFLTGRFLRYIEPCGGIGGATEVPSMTYKHEATRLKIRQEEDRGVREWVEEDHSGGVTSCID